jgi:drug/metabolite transporter (DMT)-like permease
MSPAEKQHRLQVALAFGLVYVLWGSTYLGIAIVVEHIPPAMMGAVRFLIAGPLMLGYCALTGRKITLRRTDLWRLAVVGTLLLTGGNVTVGWAEQYVPSGLAALIVAVVPIWVLVIETLVLKGDRLSGRGLAGLALGIFGMVVLLWPKLTAGSITQNMQLMGALGLVGASLSWATGSIFSRRWQFGVDAFAAAGWQTTLAGMVNLALAFALGDPARTEWTAKGLAAMAYLIVAGSWIGFSAYIWLLNHVPTQKVATYAYVNPVVAVFLGWLILRERVDVFMLAGTAIIVGAVALVTSSGMRRRVPAHERVPDLPATEPTAD